MVGRKDNEMERITKAEYERIGSDYKVVWHDYREDHAERKVRLGAFFPGQYTMEDWRRDRDFSAAVGQEISEEVFDEWLCCLPPLSIPRSAGCCGFLCSEPVRHDSAGALYRAFGSSNGRFYYLGLMHAEREEQ